jgi:hypothetical protein
MVATTLQGPEIRVFEPTVQIDGAAYRLVAKLNGTPDAEWLKLFMAALPETFDGVVDPAVNLTRTDIFFDVPAIGAVADYAERVTRTVALANERQRDRQRETAAAADRRQQKHAELVGLLGAINARVSGR